MRLNVVLIVVSMVSLRLWGFTLVLSPCGVLVFADERLVFLCFVVACLFSGKFG